MNITKLLEKLKNDILQFGQDSNETKKDVKQKCF